MTTYERFSLHEGFRRDPPPEFSQDALQAQMAAFRARGGVVQQIPVGRMASDGAGYRNTVRKSDPKQVIKARTEIDL